jgi:cyclase
LVKTRNFDAGKYIGDPINAIRIFNEKECDELMVLDIDAAKLGHAPDLARVAKFAAECRMPLCYGGGIRTVEQAKAIVALGVEKVAISSAAIENSELITRLAKEIGSQSVVVVLDVKEDEPGRYSVWTHNGTRPTKFDPVTLAQSLQTKGAGEIVINSINRDGEMRGYDLRLAREVRKVTSVPLTFLGGVGKHAHFKELINAVGVVGAAAGSLFVFKGVYRAVLINYPSLAERDEITSATLLSGIGDHPRHADA